MIFLLLSILCSTAIYAIFKLFSRYGINTFPAIVANYYVASGFGFLYAFSDESMTSAGIESWILSAAMVGILFISLFYLMAITSQKHGVAVTGIATKMSMVIPALFFMISDTDESWHPIKIAGISIGIVAVILTTVSGKNNKASQSGVLIPIFLFIGSGLLDLILAYTEKEFLFTEVSQKLFVPIPFGIAAIIGTIVLLIRFFNGNVKIKARDMAAGLFLGLVNYGSIYFLLRILGSDLLDRSEVIPANNMGVVALSAIAGVLLFKERTDGRKLLGIILALIAILLLTYFSA